MHSTIAEMRAPHVGAAILLGACAGQPPTHDLELTEPKTVALAISSRTLVGDGVDMEADATVAFGAGAADLRVIRNITLSVGTVRPDTGAQMQDVGPTLSLADVRLPPASFINPSAMANLGEGMAVYTQLGCVGAARITDVTFGPAQDGAGMDVPNAFTGVTLEYTHAVCENLALDVIVKEPSGGCAPTQVKGGALQLMTSIDGWPSRKVSPMSQDVHAPHGWALTVTAQDPVEWSGDCGGSGACTVTMWAPRHVTATLSPPLRCGPGP
jgi:hypothetical protein